MTLPPPKITTIACDPKTVHRLNGNAFQQHAITSAYDWQYAVVYVSDTPDVAGSPRYVCVARRRLISPLSRNRHLYTEADREAGEWQHVVLRDYAQTTEDGHNTISLGISTLDGRLHLVWDLHNDQIRYRRSIYGLAWADPDEQVWNAESFGVIENGLQPGRKDMLAGMEITYPRFVAVEDDLLLEFRVGKAGNGDAAFCRYKRLGPSSKPSTAEDEWMWESMRVYLRGVDCNPYVNGISYRRTRCALYVSWTNRRYTELQRESDMSGGSSQQVGPNGPENNEDLGCMVSLDGGLNWRADTDRGDNIGKSVNVARTSSYDGIISSRDPRVIVRTISRNSGIMNQEAQCVDCWSRMHVLMRDDNPQPGGTEGRRQLRWKHHYQDHLTGDWLTDVVPTLEPTRTGSRGKLYLEPRNNDIYFIIPGDIDTSLTILRKKVVASEGRLQYGSFEMLWCGQGYDGEPLIDEAGLDQRDLRLFVMTRTASSTEHEGSAIVVLEWKLPFEELARLN